jgi:hypothetical protein
VTTWTAPFHGVTHLGTCSPAVKWVTVVDYGPFATLLLWFPGCRFDPSERTCDTVEDAKKRGERWLREIGI